MDELCLKWNEHHPSVMTVFEELLEKGSLVDCTIAAGGQYMKAHKVVLAACSPYFELLFSQENEKNPIVVLKDIKFQEVKYLIDFMYRGNVKLQREELDSFIIAAESLQIKGLSEHRKSKMAEIAAKKAVRGSLSSPVPCKRRRNSRSEGIEDTRSVLSLGNDNSNDSNLRVITSVETAKTLSASITSTANCSAIATPHFLSAQPDQLPETDFSPQEEVLSDAQSVVKLEPDDTQPLPEIFLPEPKNEEYVDDMAQLESDIEIAGSQSDSSRQNTNNITGFSYGVGDAFAENQADRSATTGAAASSSAAACSPDAPQSPRRIAAMARARVTAGSARTARRFAEARARAQRLPEAGHGRRDHQQQVPPAPPSPPSPPPPHSKKPASERATPRHGQGSLAKVDSRKNATRKHSPCDVDDEGVEAAERRRLAMDFGLARIIQPVRKYNSNNASSSRTPSVDGQAAAVDAPKNTKDFRSPTPSVDGEGAARTRKNTTQKDFRSPTRSVDGESEAEDSRQMPKKKFRSPTPSIDGPAAPARTRKNATKNASRSRTPSVDGQAAAVDAPKNTKDFRSPTPSVDEDATASGSRKNTAKKDFRSPTRSVDGEAVADDSRKTVSRKAFRSPTPSIDGEAVAAGTRKNAKDNFRQPTPSIDEDVAVDLHQKDKNNFRSPTPSIEGAADAAGSRKYSNKDYRSPTQSDKEETAAVVSRRNPKRDIRSPTPWIEGEAVGADSRKNATRKHSPCDDDDERVKAAERGIIAMGFGLAKNIQPVLARKNTSENASRSRTLSVLRRAAADARKNTKEFRSQTPSVDGEAKASGSRENATRKHSPSSVLEAAERRLIAMGFGLTKKIQPVPEHKNTSENACRSRTPSVDRRAAAADARKNTKEFRSPTPSVDGEAKASGSRKNTKKNIRSLTPSDDGAAEVAGSRKNATKGYCSPTRSVDDEAVADDSRRNASMKEFRSPTPSVDGEAAAAGSRKNTKRNFRSATRSVDGEIEVADSRRNASVNEFRTETPSVDGEAAASCSRKNTKKKFRSPSPSVAGDAIAADSRQKAKINLRSPTPSVDEELTATDSRKIAKNYRSPTPSVDGKTVATGSRKNAPKVHHSSTQSLDGLSAATDSRKKNNRSLTPSIVGEARAASPRKNATKKDYRSPTPSIDGQAASRRDDEAASSRKNATNRSPTFVVRRAGTVVRSVRLVSPRVVLHDFARSREASPEGQRSDGRRTPARLEVAPWTAAPGDRSRQPKRAREKQGAPSAAPPRAEDFAPVDQRSPSRRSDRERPGTPVLRRDCSAAAADQAISRAKMDDGELQLLVGVAPATPTRKDAAHSSATSRGPSATDPPASQTARLPPRGEASCFTNTLLAEKRTTSEGEPAKSPSKWISARSPSEWPPSKRRLSPKANEEVARNPKIRKKASRGSLKDEPSSRAPEAALNTSNATSPDEIAFQGKVTGRAAVIRGGKEFIYERIEKGQIPRSMLDDPSPSGRTMPELMTGMCSDVHESSKNPPSDPQLSYSESTRPLREDSPTSASVYEDSLMLDTYDPPSSPDTRATSPTCTSGRRSPMSDYSLASTMFTDLPCSSPPLDESGQYTYTPLDMDDPLVHKLMKSIRGKSADPLDRSCRTPSRDSPTQRSRSSPAETSRRRRRRSSRCSDATVKSERLRRGASGENWSRGDASDERAAKRRSARNKRSSSRGRSEEPGTATGEGSKTTRKGRPPSRGAQSTEPERAATASSVKSEEDPPPCSSSMENDGALLVAAGTSSSPTSAFKPCGTATAFPSLAENVCATCGSLFADAASLRRHEVRKHAAPAEASFSGGSDAPPPSPRATGVHTCEECGRRFKYEASLRSHQASHAEANRPYVCETCGERFSLVTKLREHNAAEHRADVTYTCNPCGKTFTHNSNWYRHRRKHHEENERNSGVEEPETQGN